MRKKNKETNISVSKNKRYLTKTTELMIEWKNYFVNFSIMYQLYNQKPQQEEIT